MADVKGKTKIYRKDFNGRPSYSRGISSREWVDGKQGDWITFFKSVQLPKGTDLENKTIIEFEGFESAYRAKDGSIKEKTVITKFTIAEEEAPGFSALSEEDVPF